MSDQTDVEPPAAAVPTSSVLAADANGQEPVVYEVRRRRRRRRRRHDVASTPAARLHYALLALIGILFVFSLLPNVGHKAIDSLRHMLPHFAINIGGHLEVVALAIAALVVLYFTPGVEERVLRALGIKREKHRGRRG